MNKLLLKEHLSKIYEKYPFMKDSGVYSPVSNELVAEEFYNKAIDDFIKEIIAEYDNDGCPNVSDYLDYKVSIRNLDKIAEQLKEK